MALSPPALPLRAVRPGVVVPVAVAGLLVVMDLVVPLVGGAAIVGGAGFAAFHLAMVLFVVAGAVSLRLPGQVGNGSLMLGLAAAGSAFDLLAWLQAAGPCAFLQGPVYGVYAALFTHLLVRWPDADLRGARRILVAVAWIGLPLSALLWQLTWDPRWFGRTAAAWWWPVLAPARVVSGVVWLVSQILLAAVVVVGFALILLRFVRARHRSGLLPVVLAAAALGISVLLEILDSVGAGTGIDVSLVQDLAALSVPIAVVARGVRRRDAALAVSPHAEPQAFRVPPHALYRGAVLGTVLLAVALVVMVSGLATGGEEGRTAPNPAPGPALAP